MAWASRSGRARVSSSNPEAFAVCQRCGIWYNRRELKNQYAWRGAALLPTWLFVCPSCYDTPQENDRVIVLPADPVPIPLPFPEDFQAAEATVMSLSGATTDAQTGLTLPNTTAMSTTDGVMMGPTPTGRPPGYDALDRAPVTPNDVVVFMAEAGLPYMALADGTYMATEEQGAQMSGGLGGPVPPQQTDEQGVEYNEPVPVVSMMANGTPLVTCTCNAAHGLKLNSQIMVRGSAQPLADGIFSVIPITATAFTYGTYSPVPAGSILGANTIVVTTKIGLPREFQQVPQTGLPQSPPTKTSQ